MLASHCLELLVLQEGHKDDRSYAYGEATGGKKGWQQIVEMGGPWSVTKEYFGN